MQLKYWKLLIKLIAYCIILYIMYYAGIFFLMGLAYVIGSNDSSINKEEPFRMLLISTVVLVFLGYIFRRLYKW